MRGHVDTEAAPGPPSPRSRFAPWARTAADALTFSRLFGGIALGLYPWERAAHALGALLKINILLWSADAADGALARKSQTPASWIGQRDMLVDSIVTLGNGVALVRAGYISGPMLVAWIGLCGMLYVLRPAPVSLLVFMFPLQAGLPALALVHRAPELRLFLLWLAVLAWAGRRRLKWVIDTFVAGLPEGARRWVRTWLPSWLTLSASEQAAFDPSKATNDGETVAAAGPEGSGVVYDSSSTAAEGTSAHSSRGADSQSRSRS